MIGAQGSKARRGILRRPEPCRWQRARRRAPRTYRAERRGQPPQPHGDRGGHHLADEQGEAADAITSKQDKTNLPTHIGIKAGTGGLTRDSVVLLEQVRTLDKRRLRERAGQIDPDVQRRVDEALEISFGLETF